MLCIHQCAPLFIHHERITTSPRGVNRGQVNEKSPIITVLFGFNIITVISFLQCGSPYSLLESVDPHKVLYKYPRSSYDIRAEFAVSENTDHWKLLAPFAYKRLVRRGDKAVYSARGLLNRAMTRASDRPCLFAKKMVPYPHIDVLLDVLHCPNRSTLALADIYFELNTKTSSSPYGKLRTSMKYIKTC